MSSGKTCSVFNCSNSSNKITIWKKKQCERHKLPRVDCPCLVPYGLHRFPGRAQDEDIRQKWVKNINRQGWVPNNNSRVCGIHFPDGRPTKEHPYPVLHMGYEPHAELLPSGRAPPKRGCVEPLTVNALQVNRFAAEPADVEVDVDNLENIPLQKCDVGDQWPEISEHNCCSSKSTKDRVTQTDSAPSTSASDLDDKDSVAAQDSSSPIFVPSVFPWSQQSQKLNTNMGRNQRKRLVDDMGTPPHQPVALTTKQGVASLDSSNPDFGSSVFPWLHQSLKAKMGRNQRKRRIDDMGTPPNQPVAWTTKQGHLAKRAPEVKKEDVTEVIVGETGERTPTANASESPETFSVEGRYAAGTWEQATVEAIMSLRLLGTTVTTTQVAQTIIANLKDENDFLRAHNANLRSELNAKQWTHEQEISDLQERLEILKQKCSCGAMSEKTVTSSEAALSDVMVAEIKTEHLSLC
ncbi:uncharacterized protein LOC121694347 isoform X2 [Alosa sapidissima]|uniref:uncharacterized protein LOC121694347 isoform X2 n=1 Tax=Alosa sapidissima TaxID=34773 RepID=UPI001C083222|nr:uncharacterized protein LOC121694347 isoform X2 [Alosa sapidissima]